MREGRTTRVSFGEEVTLSNSVQSQESLSLGYMSVWTLNVVYEKSSSYECSFHDLVEQQKQSRHIHILLIVHRHIKRDRPINIDLLQFEAYIVTCRMVSCSP